MEQRGLGFQAMLLEGDGSAAFLPPLTIAHTACDTCINNAMCSGFGAGHHPFFPSLDYCSGTSSLGFSSSFKYDPVSFDFSCQNVHAVKCNENLGECSVDADRSLQSFDFALDKLKLPKDEPSSIDYVHFPATEPFNFISTSSDPISSYLHLPNLHSLEQVHDDLAVAESPSKRARSFSSSPDSYTLESIIQNFKYSSYFAGLKPPECEPSAARSQSSMTRRRRQMISDKTRSLQKLLPWDRKMDTATMLEEAYKYIQFLQAQVSALQSMPCHSSSFAAQHHGNVNPFGRLGRLNRQQLLQVLVNSPVAQTLLYSQGCCVFSVEQLVLLKKIADRNALLRQMTFDPSMLS